jgi:hypothetical protein
MDFDSVLIEASFALGKHSGKCNLTPDGAAMFSRLLDLTVRAGMASTPDLWESPETGRAYLLGVVAEIAQLAAKTAGAGHDLTGEILRRAANDLIERERRRFGLPRLDPSEFVLSKFCFCYVLTDLFDPPPDRS